MPLERLRVKKGIEVGHIFYIGTKYSDSMKAYVNDKNGQQISVHMGCYGIGVSRLVAAIIEANSDSKGIIWPWSVAPFQVSVINIGPSNEQCCQLAQEIYQNLQTKKIKALLDDKDTSAGAKFATHDLIGSPWQIIISAKALELGEFEVKKRANSQVFKLSKQELFCFDFASQP